jgi:diguanylate cyclase (GGDEF)-like protein
MEIRAILLISSLLFACGFFGLLTVQLTNPFFTGIGWLGGAFGVGSLGAMLFAVNPGISTGLAVVLPNTLILLAYVLLHVGIADLTEGTSRVPKLGIALLVLQPLACLAFSRARSVDRYCIVVLGVLLAAQCIQSATLLRKSANPGLLAPAWFSIILLCGFAAYNLARSVVVYTLGISQNPQAPNPLEVVTAFVFLGTGLGLGFGLFWIASSHLRIVIEDQANIDPLTGVCNRRLFTSYCEQEVKRSLETKEPFSLFLLDVDHFKQINDVHGHAIGDAVLSAVAAKVRDSVRHIDVVGRWGGEEFVALLPGAEAQMAIAVARRLRENVQALQVSNFLQDATVEDRKVTVSIGVATYLGEGDTVTELMHRCDVAMYQAKARGRNRIVFTDTQYA